MVMKLWSRGQLIQIILQIWTLTDEKGIRWCTKQTHRSCLWPLIGDENREFIARSWWDQLGRIWKANGTKLKGMHKTDNSDITLLGLYACVYKEISYAPCLERLLQGKGSIKYAHKNSYKEKTSKPRKRCQPSTTIKTPIHSPTKVCIIWKVFGRHHTSALCWVLSFCVVQILFRAREDRATYCWFFGIIRKYYHIKFFHFMHHVGLMCTF